MDTTLTILEKNEKMAKKRIFEANNSHSNLLFALPMEEITNFTYDMGVIIEKMVLILLTY